MEPVRIGVIGCGVIGQHHLKAAKASPLVSLLAVADVRPEALERAAREFSVPRAYSSGEALLDDREVEAVVLALPTCWRTPLALKAFSAGKHVLTEKPVAMNADEVEQMILAKGSLVGACCSSRYRFLESSDAAERFVATGALGEIHAVRCHAIAPAGPPPKSTPPAWRLSRALNGGGIMMNWGCYDLDFLLGILGWKLQPRRALARCWPIAEQFASHVASGSDAESHVAAFVECEGGAAILYERAEYAVCRPEGTWQISGSRGTLHLKMSVSSDKVIARDSYDPASGVTPHILWQGSEDWAAVHNGPVLDFASAIRKNRLPKTSLEHALVVQKVTDAIYASAERGHAVEIP